ncbi:hypothetical protein GCM10023100_64820 [Actinocorallia cavernae]|uniref:Uncharacterized protein n=2 Tax=Actinomycetes TaxID=1760 RepID=A0ABP8T6Q3_9ACTN
MRTAGQRTQAAGQVGKLEGVPAEHVDVMPHERGEAALVALPGPGMEDLPGEGVATLLEVRLALDLPPVAGLVGQAQDVQGLGDPPVVGGRVAERGGPAVAGQHPDHVVRARRRCKWSR